MREMPRRHRPTWRAGQLAARRWLSNCSILSHGRAPHGEVLPRPNLWLGGRTMVKLLRGARVVLASFLLVGPVIEVGHVGVHADLPGHRHRGLERRGTRRGGTRDAASLQLQAGDRARCPVGSEGPRPPLLFAGFVASRPRSSIRSHLAPRGGTGASVGLVDPVRGSTADRSATIPARSIRPASAIPMAASVAEQIFDGLVQFDQTLTVSPALARFWKASRDGLTWTVQLATGSRPPRAGAHRRRTWSFTHSRGSSIPASDRARPSNSPP